MRTRLNDRLNTRLMTEDDWRFIGQVQMPELIFQPTQAVSLFIAMCFTGLTASMAYDIAGLNWVGYLLIVTPLCLAVAVIGALVPRGTVAQFLGTLMLAVAAGVWWGCTLGWFSVSLFHAMLVAIPVVLLMALWIVPLMHDWSWLVVGGLAILLALSRFGAIGLYGLLVGGDGIATAEWLTACVICAWISFVLQRSFDLDATLDNATASALSVYRDPLIWIGRAVTLPADIVRYRKQGG